MIHSDVIRYDMVMVFCLGQAEAAEQRSRQFQQGGGGEKLKAKAKALEQAEKKNADLGGPPALKWTV